MQSKDLSTLPEGVPGSPATLNPMVHTVHNPLAEGAGVTVGNFVWRGTDPIRQVKVGGTGAPLGLAERNLVYARCQNVDSLGLLEGETVTVVTHGDMYVTTTTAATIGQKVFAVLATGAIATGAAEASIEGAVETDWVVESAGSAGDTIIISHWS